MHTINFSAKEDEFRLMPPANSDELRWRSGYNIGNWLFTSGVNNLISQENSSVIKFWFSPFEELKADRNNNYSSRVINVSNWIHAKNIDVLEAYTEQIRRQNIPTYLLGIGAQIKTEKDRSTYPAEERCGAKVLSLNHGEWRKLYGSWSINRQPFGKDWPRTTFHFRMSIHVRTRNAKRAIPQF